MRVLLTNQTYLATIVKNGHIKTNIVIAKGARSVEVVLTGELLPMHKLGSIQEVSSC